MKLHIYFYLMILTLVVALWHYRKFGKTFMALLIPAIASVVAVEFYTYYLKVNNIPNGWVYNLHSPLMIVVYSFIISKFLQNPRVRKWLNRAVIAIVICVYAYQFLIAGIGQFSPMINCVCSIVMVASTCFLFYEYLNTDDYSIYRNWSSALWLGSGLMIFYAGITYCFSMYQYILDNNLTLFGQKLYVIIPRYLSIILYSCLTIALLVWKQKWSTSR